MLGLGVAVVLAHLVIGEGPLPVHGDADWIMRDPDFAWCCGPDDCGIVPDGEVVAKDGGWFVPATGQRFKLGDHYTFWSKDDRMWWCRVKGFNGTPMLGVIQCLFVPRIGT